MFKFLRKIFDYKIPVALSLEDWDKWHKEQKQKHPVKYHLCYTLNNKTDRIYRRISNFLYFIECHTYKKYHILDLRKGDTSKVYNYGWIDFGTAVIYAVFILLERHIEDLDRGIIIEDEVQMEAREIYRWFKEDYSKKLEALDQLITELVENFDQKYDYLEQITKLELEIDEEVNKRLKRLIEIRKYLWV